MRSTRQQGSLLGIGMLGIGLVAGFAPTASAQTHAEVREDRKAVRKATKNVQEQRRDVRRADTPAQKYEQQEQLRDARGDLHEEKQDLRQELNQRNAVNPNYRYNGNTRYVPNYAYNGNTRYVPNYAYNNRYNGNTRYNSTSVFRTVEGVVTSDLRGNNFALRATNGQQMSVQTRGGEPRRISRGDRVRVYGSFTGGVFRAQNLAILRNR